jgi:hypothetical protein
VLRLLFYWGSGGLVLAVNVGGVHSKRKARLDKLACSKQNSSRPCIVKCVFQSISLVEKGLYGVPVALTARGLAKPLNPDGLVTDVTDGHVITKCVVRCALFVSKLQQEWNRMREEKRQEYHGGR